MKYVLILMIVVDNFMLGTSLDCYQHGLSPLDCKFETITCPKDELCYKKTGKIKNNLIASLGCTSADQCDKTYETDFAGLTVSLRTFCCSNDLCNGSTDVKIAHTMGAVLVLGWIICFL